MQTTNNSTQNLTLVIDQGSHASRIVLFSETGKQLYQDSVSISTHSPADGLFEQDANEILNSINTLLDRLEPRFTGKIKNCSLCTQRSTVVAWHKQTGETLSPAISWRDRRNQPLQETLEFARKDIQKITGLPLSPHYSASKMHWLLEHNKKVKQAATEQQLCLAPLASFLVFHLLKNRPYVLDHCNAQRSQLFDIETLNWSEPLLTLFQIGRDFLPTCQAVVSLYGELEKYNIPMTSVCGDQNAALHAYPALLKDQALVNIGTGAFVLSPSPEKNDSNRLLRSITYSKDKDIRYATEGTVNGAGTAIDQASKIRPSLSSILSDDIFKHLPQWLAEKKRPAIFINTVAGLGSPWWCDGGKAGFISAEEINPGDAYVAIIESIIFLIFSNIQQFKILPSTLYISGGLSKLDGLCQSLANLSQAKVIRLSETESTARGSAWLANQIDNSTDQWQPLKIKQKFIPIDDTNMDQRYQQFVGELEKRCHSD